MGFILMNAFFSLIIVSIATAVYFLITWLKERKRTVKVRAKETKP